MNHPRAAALAGLVCTLGCESDETAAVVPPPACGELELALPDGSCFRPGILPDGCAAGFVHDGEYGCEPILPAEPCARGLMAVPSDAVCRPVMTCGTGKWGDIPIDATTEHVDGAYMGGASDGSANAPWLTIGEAYAAAAPGALIAIAEGNYVEDVIIAYKPARLWGVCPERVVLEGIGAELATLIVGAQANGSEVHAITLRGRTTGLYLVGSANVLVDRVWVDGTGDRGINVQSVSGDSSITIVDSLVELAHQFGIYVSGSDAVITSSVVRGTFPAPGTLIQGRGIHLQPSCPGGPCISGAPANATVSGSLIEQNHDAGMLIWGSTATVEGTVVRDTLPREVDALGGRGIAAEPCHDLDGCVPATPSHLTLRTSLIERSREVGVAVVGTDAVIDRTVIRDTSPSANNQRAGRGIGIDLCTSALCTPIVNASATITSSLVERSHEIGVFAAGTSATLELSVVRDTLPDAVSGELGTGIHLQYPCTFSGCDITVSASGIVRRSLVERNHTAGILTLTSLLMVEHSVVRETLADMLGQFGDGIGADLAAAEIPVTNTRIDDSARAGMSSFGSSLSLGGTMIRCAAFDLAGEVEAGTNFVFQDRGGNLCGCPDPAPGCKAVSVGLAPPKPVQ